MKMFKRMMCWLPVLCCLAAFAMLSSSCVKEQAEELSVFQAADMPTLTATTASEIPVTKASITPVEDEARAILWDKGDALSVFYRNGNNLKYVLEGDGGTASGDFSYSSGTVAAPKFKEVVALYPYDGAAHYSNGVLDVTIPAEQTYTENTFDPKAFPMVGVADEEGKVAFGNVCGFFVLRLYGADATVKSVKLTGAMGEQMAGPVKVTVEAGEAPHISDWGMDAADEVVLKCATPVKVGATIEEATEFWFVLPPMTFMDGISVKVECEGFEIGRSSDEYIEIYRSGVCWMDELELKVFKPEYVEMAPGFYMATTNIGAETPEEPGYYFAWGETETKDTYSWRTYKFMDEEVTSGYYGLNKYTFPNGYYNNYSCSNWYRKDTDQNGKTIFVFTGDALRDLEPEDDAALANWGEGWSIPNPGQWGWLVKNCTWTWDAEKEGYTVTSPETGNSIYLPATGRMDGSYVSYDEYGYYWTSRASRQVTTAYDLFFYDTYYNCKTSTGTGEEFGNYTLRYYGIPVRAVYGTVDATAIEVTPAVVGMSVGDKKRLEVAFTPEYASNQDFVWSSDDETVAKVDTSGVTAVGPGETVVRATNPATGVVGTCTVSVGVNGGHEFVEMAPGFFWATTNLGADTPEEAGDYFAWGETEPKESYTWSNYAFNGGESQYGHITKYTRPDGKTWADWYTEETSGYVFSGDALTQLEAEDDAATAQWGEEWHTPNKDQWMWLKNYCTWTWDAENEGYTVKSKSTGNSIFLPVTGYMHGSELKEAWNPRGEYWGYYWSASTSHFTPCSYVAQFWSTNCNYDMVYTAGEENGSIMQRAYGVPVRPVFGTVPVTYVSLSSYSLSMEVGQKAKLTATVSPLYASYSDFEWSSSDESVAKVDTSGVEAVGPGTATITVTEKSSGLKRTAKVVSREPSIYWDTFENGTNQWVLIDKDGDDYTWLRRNVYQYTESYGYVLESWRRGTSSDHWAYSPTVLLGTDALPGPFSLAFWAKQSITSYDDHFAVMITTDDPDDPDAELETLLEGNLSELTANQSSGNGWKRFIIDIPSKYYKMEVRFVFRHLVTDYDGYEIYLDDVAVVIK